VDVLRHFTQWKCRLMPYLWDAAVQARDHGTPMVRPLLLEFPQDLNTHSLDRQYLLGSQLLVAPVLRSDSEVDVYLPEGRWTHLFTGEVVDGGRWRHERHGMLSLPLYVRPGSLLALGARNDRPDYDYRDGLELHLFELADGQTSSVRVPDAQGNAVLHMYVRRDGQHLHLRWQGQLWSAVLVLRGLHGLLPGVGELRVQASAQGLRVHLPEDGQTLDLQLA
jgi:alpha-D-xyloside xylohydrolase